MSTAGLIRSAGRSLVDGPDTTGKALVEFWRHAGDKGLMNANTARAIGQATAQVLSVLDDWQSQDLQTANLEDVWRRFQNKHSRSYKPESLNAYKRRFMAGVKSFLNYVADPSAWRPPISGERVSRKERLENSSGAPARLDLGEPVQSTEKGVVMVDYPFPLREGRLAILRLPADLKAVEVRRLTAYLNTLVVDAPNEP
jgi:hypothetical protein